MKGGFVNEPTLRIPLHVWHKLMSYVLVCPIEVNGFGLITRIGEALFLLDDVMITDQLATGGSVDVDKAVIGKFINDLAVAGVDTGRLRFQWHSHVNFDAHFSTIDTANIESYGKGWTLSLVVNKKSEYEARIDVFQPFRVSSTLRIEIDVAPNQALLEMAKRDVSRHVRTPGRIAPRGVAPQQPFGGVWPHVDPTAVTLAEVQE